jgi:tetratricopeptide (TPR) repeat protein
MPRLAPLLLTASLLALGSSAPARGQGEQEARRREVALKRYQTYLSRKPFHAWAFDKLVEAAVGLDKLEALVKEYQALEEPTLAQRVVLGRLYARVDRLDEALELLGKLGKEQKLAARDRTAWLALRGGLLLRAERAPEALELLDQAAAAAGALRDQTLIERLHRERGEAALAAGQRARAVKAFRALGALAPRSLTARLEVARLLSENGLVDEALVDLGVAKEIAGSDAAQACRVLSEVGRLHERRLRIRPALAAYREAIDLMQRGNWLLRELRGRVLAIHRRTGQLEALIKETRAEVVRKLGQLEPREFLTEVLEAADRPKEARDLLEGAIEDFPADLALGRRLLDVLERLGDTEGRVREYQRQLGHHPEELDLYLELGKAFASSGRLGQAKRQWQATLKSRLKDPALCRRLSELYARYDQLQDAVELSKRALELSPNDTSLVGELAQLLRRAKRGAEVPPLLAAAAERVGKDPVGRRAIASLYESQGEPRRALELLRDLRPEAAVLRQRVRLHLALDEPEAALAAQRLLVGAGSDAASRERAASAFLRLARKASRLPKELARAEQEVQAKSKSLAPYLILARAALRDRDAARAEQILADLLLVLPGQVDAHRALARLAERRGDVAAALLHQRALLETRGAPPRKALLAMARLHLTRYERDEALAAYRKVLAASPGNPAAFREVAKEYEGLGLTDEARRCLQQAVRLSPDDGKLRLELARVLERLGERARAREEILAATRCKDRRQREKARAAYYRSLVSEGTLEAKVADLRRRSLDNPYDVEAPLTLIDLYVRELEYEPALELVERLLGYQPRQVQFLAQRARLCNLLERHEEAIATYESLWRLPDQDRKRLSLDMADAALARGDLAKAEQALQGARDPIRVARLYERHHLPERALKAIQAGLKSSPQDARLHHRQARLLRARGDREAAAQSLEAWLNLRGERFPQLKELGQLYHQLGRKQDALRCGRRLLAILRQHAPKDPADEDDEDEDEESRRERRWRAERRRALRDQLRERIREAEGFFTSNALAKEFPAAALAEWRLQPDNDLLLSALVRAARGPEAAKLALSTLDEAARSERRPRSFTAQNWRLHLASLRRGLLERETGTRKETSQSLSKRLAELKPSEGTLLLSLLDSARRSQELDQALDALLKRSPREPRYLLARAERAESRGDPAAAIPDLELALEVLSAPDSLAALRKEVLERQELSLAQRQTKLRESWPLRARAQIRSEALARLDSLSRDPWPSGDKTGWRAGREPHPLSARAALARCAAAAKRPALAKAALDGLRPPATPDPLHPDSLKRWGSLAQAYFERDLPEEGARICQELLERERALERDPVLGLTRSWAYLFEAPLRRWAQELARQGKHLAAYDLYRTYGEPGAARLLLEEHQLLPQARAQAARELAAAEAAHAKGGPGSRERLHRAFVRAGELAQWAKDWPAAQTLFERGAEALPQAWDLYHARARLELRAERPDAAVAIYEEAIERKRAARRRPAPPRPRGRTLTPLEPEGLVQAQHWAFSNLRWALRSEEDASSPRVEHVAVMRIHLERRRSDRAAAALRQLAREDVDTFRWISYSLGRLIRDARLGASGLPILKLLWENDDRDAWLGLDVAEALLEGGDAREAQRVLRRVQAGLAGWLETRARQLGERIERRLGGGQAKTLAELRAAAAKEPKQAKARLPLVRRLILLRRFDEALEQARQLVTLAPHNLQGRRLLRRLLTIRADDAGLEEQIRAELRRAKDDEQRFQHALSLATLFERPGQATPKLEAALREAKAAAGSPPRYNLANWHFARGREEQGLAALEAARKEQPRGQWVWRETTERLLGVYQRLERGAAFWALVRELVEEQSSAGERWSAFTQVTDALRARRRTTESLLHGSEKLPAPWPALAGLAVAIAQRDLPAAEGALAKVLASEDELVTFLRPLGVQIADSAGNTALALERLERILQGGALSQSVQTPIGQLSERRLGQAVAGRLLLELEREDEALARWKKVVDPSDPASKLAYARLLARHRRFDEACAQLEAHLQREGATNPEHLRWLASWEEQRGQPAKARAALTRAATLATGSDRDDWDDPRATVAAEILAHHRRAKTLPLYREELEARLEKDPDDIQAASSLIELLAELGDDAACEVLLETLAKTPAKAPGALRLLAAAQQRAGKFELAAASLGKVLPGQQSDQPAQRGARRAALLWTAGQREQALAALRKGYQDPTSSTALRAERSFLEQRGEWADALRAHDQSQLGRALPRQRGTRAKLLERLGRYAEALGELWGMLEVPEGADDQDRLAPQLLRLERLAVGQVAPVTSGGVAALASEAALDPELRAGFRRAVLARARGQLEAAATQLGALRARFPEHLPSAWGELEVLQLLERWPAAEERLAALYPRLQRLVAASCAPAGLLQEAWRLRGALRLAQGDRAGALERWKEPLKGRYATPETYRFSLWNPIQDPLSHRLLTRHGLLEDALKSGQVNSSQRVQTLIRLGRAQEALALARRESFDLIEGELSDMGLIQSARAAGGVAEVRSAALAQWTRRPSDSRRLFALAALSEDPSAALTFLLRSRRPGQEHDPDELERELDLLIELERFSDALPLSRAKVAAARGSSARLSTSGGLISVSGPSSRLRFQWGGSGGSGGYYMWRNQSPGDLSAERSAEAQLLALLARAGLHEERVQREGRWLAAASQLPSARRRLAKAYASQGALAEAIRVATGEPRPALAEDRVALWRALLREVAHRREPELQAGQRRLLAEFLGACEAQASERPAPADRARVEALTWLWHVATPAQRDLAKAANARLLATHLSSRADELRAAWLELRRGERSAARARLERVRAESYRAGRGEPRGWWPAWALAQPESARPQAIRTALALGAQAWEEAELRAELR